jgi:hypothetical protein
VSLLSIRTQMKFSGASESTVAVPLRCLTNTLSRCGADWPTRTKARTPTCYNLPVPAFHLPLTSSQPLEHSIVAIELHSFCSLVHFFSRIGHHLWPNRHWPCCALPWDLFHHCPSYQRLSSKHLRSGQLLVLIDSFRRAMSKPSKISIAIIPHA